MFFVQSENNKRNRKIDWRYIEDDEKISESFLQQATKNHGYAFI